MNKHKEKSFGEKHPVLRDNMETLFGILGGSFLFVGVLVAWIKEKAIRKGENTK